jgi:hypothetical protein
MKKLIALIFIIPILSCSKSKEIDSHNSLDYLKIEKVETELEQQKQLDMYIALNSEERLEIWNNRITNFIKSGKLTASQKDILNFVSRKLDKSVFELDVKGTTKARDIETEITPMVLKSFSKQEMKQILGSLKPIGKNYKSGLKPNSIKTGCECNGSSVWDCDRCTGGCSQSAHGCGTFLLFSCNYMCAGIPPNNP